MIPVTQTEIGVDNPRGNCLMACVASILEVPLESLPDLYEREKAGDHWFTVLAEVLASHGLKPIEGGKRDLYHIGVGPSPRSDMPHAVVMLGTEMVHDPHPDRTGLVASVLTYWISLEPC
jgi:hypothetical protein